MKSPPNLYDILSELNYIEPDKIHNYSKSIIAHHDINNTMHCCLQATDPPQISDLPDFTKDSNGNIINDYPYTLKEFNRFLIRTHCEENLEFFIMTKQFLLYDDKKSLRSNSIVSTISSNMYSNFDLELWDEQIYNIFIKVDSPKECNLPQYIRGLFDDCHRQEVPPKQIYIIQAIQHVLGLLLDAYTRFIQYIQQTSSEEWARRKLLLENAVETTTTKTITNTTATAITSTTSRNENEIKASANGHWKSTNKHIKNSSKNKKNIESDTSTISKGKDVLILTRRESTRDSNTSILLKSRKLLRKIKKTIQI